ncbi:MAG: F0F1 ATP synthase subunit B [Puniceicoccales bacterium]|jgi:F-type H+-transporting ATPase subunit b|nr:F0F1 ATP synthase subunit B [Puniceicoccales bacterium]
MFFPHSPAAILAAATTAAEAAGRLGFDWRHVTLQLGSFALMALVLYYFGIRPLLANLDARNAKIESGLQYAEEMKARLNAAEAQCEERLAAAATEAANIAREAGARAKAFEEKAAREAGGRAAEILRRAESQLAHERAQMLAELRAEIARLVVETTGRVLAKELTPDEKMRFNATAALEITNVSGHTHG